MNDQKKPNDFFAATLDEKACLQLKAAGRGGMKALSEHMAGVSDRIVVGCFRVTAVDDRGVTVSYRTKLIMVTYVPQGLPAMKRAKAASYNSSFNGMFISNMQLQIDDPADLTEADMEKRLRSSGGAHQPTSYDFTNESIDNKKDE